MWCVASIRRAVPTPSACSSSLLYVTNTPILPVTSVIPPPNHAARKETKAPPSECFRSVHNRWNQLDSVLFFSTQCFASRLIIEVVAGSLSLFLVFSWATGCERPTWKCWRCASYYSHLVQNYTQFMSEPFPHYQPTCWEGGGSTEGYPAPPSLDASGFKISWVGNKPIGYNKDNKDFRVIANTRYVPTDIR